MPARNPYFLIVSLVMLLLVFAGFAPTFFLRPFFDVPDLATGTRLPVHLFLHGVALASWYTLFTVQAWLVYTGKTRNHRALGKIGFIAAIATVATAFWVLAEVYPRRIAAGQAVPEPVIESFRGLMVIQGGNVILFALCITAAIYFRHKPDIHKRLMLIGSILIFGAALSTNRLFGAAMQNMLPFSLVDATHLLLVGSLVVHDAIRKRKMMLVSLPAAVFVMSRSWFFDAIINTEMGVAWANWLGGLPQ